MINEISATGPRLAALMGGIFSDAQALLKQEVALARSELSDELGETKRVVLSIGIGAAILAVGVLFLVLLVVDLLHEELQLKMWQSYGIVGGILTLAGVVLLLLARARVSAISFVPKQTVETLKENVQWIKNQS